MKKWKVKPRSTLFDAMEELAYIYERLEVLIPLSISATTFTSSFFLLLCICLLTSSCSSSKCKCGLIYSTLISRIASRPSHSCFSLWVWASCLVWINSRKCWCDISKECLDINTNFGTSFHKHGSKLISKSLSIFCSHLALFCQVNFVADDYYGDGVAANLTSLFNPALNILKAGPWCNIITHNCYLRVIDIRWYERTEPFLSCSVPKLQPDHFIINIDCFRQEINTYRCL